MTAPQDPFGTPPQDGPGAPPAGYGSPAPYGQSPASGQDPFAQPPAYGQDPYGQPPAYGQQSGQQSPYGQPAYGQQPFGAPPAGDWAGPPLASWGQRLAGYLIDSLIVFAIVQGVASISEGLANALNLALVVALGAITGIKGQTPGRQLMKISVVKEVDGTFLGAGAGIGRQFLHLLDALPLLLGFFWPIWDKKNQTFADKIIKSVVIKVG